MDAAVLHTLGKAPRCEGFPEPVAGDAEAIVHIHAAALKPVDRQLAAGSHYASPREVPVVCGTDGVGHLDDGTRVFFGGPRPPYGTMAQRTVVPRAFCFPIPDELDDEVAAALPNPGVSAWLVLAERARLLPGETVLILGATGVAGKLAVQIAKLQGAARIVAAGRNQQALDALGDLGADATIQLDQPDPALAEAFARAAGDIGFGVIVDYVWGHPTEVLLSAMTRHEFAAVKGETRLVQVGESAGAAITLPAAVLRSAPITILGTAGVPPGDVLMKAFQQVMSHGAAGRLRVDTEAIRLADIEGAWQREARSGVRLVVIP